MLILKLKNWVSTNIRLTTYILILGRSYGRNRIRPFTKISLFRGPSKNVKSSLYIYIYIGLLLEFTFSSLTVKRV